jgi:hypothetical protein
MAEGALTVTWRAPGVAGMLNEPRWLNANRV